MKTLRRGDTPVPKNKIQKQTIAETWAMANMNMIIHDVEGQIEIGDTFKNPKFRDKRGKLRTFDRVVAATQRGSAILMRSHSAERPAVTMV